MTNPLLTPSSLPCGLPDFARIEPHHYAEAMAAGMAEQLRVLDEMKRNPEPPTVANTLGTWEDSRRLRARAMQAFYAVHACDATEEMDAINTEFAPKLAAHNDAIFLDADLYARFAGLRRRAEAGEVSLDDQDDWSLAELERAFVRSGVKLGDEDQARLRALNTKLATLSSSFERATRAARNAGAIVLTEEETAGLSEAEKDALRTPEGYRVELVNTSQHPLLAKLENRDVRRRLFEASIGRSLSGEHDTRQLIIDIARARAERAALLGYPSHAALVAEQGVAKTTEAIAEVVVPIAQAAVARAKEEAAELAELFATRYGGEFSPWDWGFTAAWRRRETGFDEAQVAEFLDVDRVLAAVYQAATDLYGITFVPRPELRGHTADADVYEVHDADGLIGLFVMDFWARPTKNGGAWMNSLVVQSEYHDELPVVTNNCNYTRGAKAITWDGVITMFHEFGHALHGLFSSVRYPSRSGTATPRDFVEFPSQVNEHWAWQPGRVLDAEWLEKLKRAEQFGQGFGTAETLMATLLDQSWHQASLDELPASPEEVEAFEKAALERWGVAYDMIPPRYRSTYFSHIWAGGYSAGYYGYLWSEVMDADAVAWFEHNGGGTRANGDHFRKTLLAPGGSVDPAQTYRNFRGQDPEVGPLLERLGFSSEG